MEDRNTRTEETPLIWFEKGEYYIGDLCYAINGDNEWHDIMLDIDGTEWGLEGPKLYKGQLIFSHGTFYGDGGYSDNQGNYYSVDSGTIGIIPISLVNMDYYSGGGQIMIFDNDFEVLYSNGMFKFGAIEIETKDINEEEEDYIDNEDNDEPDDNTDDNYYA
jgi:hypothetical protein